MLLCLGLGAAGIAAAEVTLEGFPNHWTQDNPGEDARFFRVTVDTPAN